MGFIVAARRAMDPALPLPCRFRALQWCVESYIWLTRGSFHAAFQRLGRLHGFDPRDRLDAARIEAAVRTLAADRERFLYGVEELARRRGAAKATGRRVPAPGEIEALYASAADPGPVDQASEPVRRRFDAAMDRIRRGLPRADAGRALRAASELRLWDWTWIEAPPPGEPGPGAVLALVGSTDLGCYHLARLRFRGVRHSTCPRYFHHPEFQLVPREQEGALRRGVAWGPDSFAVVVWTEAGSPLAEAFHVVADAVELEVPAPGERTLRTPYVPGNPAHVEWWGDDI